MTNKLELRMYFFVLYSLSGIQKGIQAGHSALEYADKYKHTSTYKEFIKNHKTWILLNGGTSRDGCLAGDYASNAVEDGTLNDIDSALYNMAIPHVSFREPDLNFALTAVCFICDERVFNKKKYPDYDSELWGTQDSLVKPRFYEAWVELIGGENNAFLRELLRNKTLA